MSIGRMDPDTGAATQETTRAPSPKPVALLVTLTAAALVLRLALGPVPGYETDTAQFIAWADAGALHPLGEMYARTPTNYPPGWVSLFWLLGKTRSAFPILTRPDVRYLFIKTPAIVADLVVACLIYLIVARNLGSSSGNWAAALYLFNPAVISDSTIWGQSDGMVPLFPLMALLALERKAWWLVGPLLAAALATKFQSLVLVLPLLVFVLADFGIWRTAVTLAAGLLAFGLVALPFILTTGQFHRMLQLGYLQNVGLLPMLRLGAFNFWDVVNPAVTADDYSLVRVFGISVTPRLIGLALFAMAWLPAALAGCARRSAIARAYALGMAAWSFFMFPTEMHERYLLPAVAFFSVSAPTGPNATAVLAAVSGIHLYSCYFRYSWGSEALGPAMRVLLLPCFLAAMYRLHASLADPEVRRSLLVASARWVTDRPWLPISVLCLASVCAALAVNGWFHELANEVPLVRLGPYRSAQFEPDALIHMAPGRTQSLQFRFPPVFGVLRAGTAVEEISKQDDAPCAATFSVSSPEGELYASDPIAAGSGPQPMEVPLPAGTTDITLSIHGTGCGTAARMSWSDARLVSWRSPSRWQHQDVIFLSDIPEELPWPFLGPRATGSWRRDRSIHGNPITIGGHGFTKGLGTQASSVISFHVPEGMTAFVSDVGDDDEVPTERRGPRTRAVVLVDGRERYRSPELEPRQRMTDVRVPLDGARRVTLITEAGPQGDAVDWGDARFVRGAGT